MQCRVIVPGRRESEIRNKLMKGLGWSHGTKKAAIPKDCGFEKIRRPNLLPNPAISEETKDTKTEDQSISGRLRNGLHLETIGWVAIDKTAEDRSIAFSVDVP